MEPRHHPHPERSEFRVSFNKKGNEPLVPQHVRMAKPRRIFGISPRTSTRWFDEKSSKRSFTPIPYVTVSGKFSASTLCFWTAYPEQIVASLTSTVYLRILKIVSKRHGWNFARSCRETIFKTAAYYSVTHDDGFLNRVLGIFKKRNRRAVHNHYTYAFCNLTENFRFVISQICSQILWLSFRSRTVQRTVNTRRDKVSNDDCSLSSFSLEMDESGFQMNDEVSWRLSAQVWKNNLEKNRKWDSRAPSRTRSEFESYLSETSDY